MPEQELPSKNKYAGYKIPDIRDEGMLREMNDLTRLMREGVDESKIGCEDALGLLSHLKRFDLEKARSMAYDRQYEILFKTYNDTLDIVNDLKQKYKPTGFFTKSLSRSKVKECKAEVQGVIDSLIHLYRDIIAGSVGNTEKLRRYMEIVQINKTLFHDKKILTKNSKFFREYYDPFFVAQTTKQASAKTPMRRPSLIQSQETSSARQLFRASPPKPPRRPSLPLPLIEIKQQQVRAPAVKQQKTQIRRPVFTPSQETASARQLFKASPPKPLADIKSGRQTMTPVMKPSFLADIKSGSNKLKPVGGEQQTQTTRQQKAQIRTPVMKPSFLADIKSGSNKLKPVGGEQQTQTTRQQKKPPSFLSVIRSGAAGLKPIATDAPKKKVSRSQSQQKILARRAALMGQQEQEQQDQDWMDK